MASHDPAAAAVTLADLPHDMLREIAARLPYKSVGALALACKSARDALVDRPSQRWRTVTCGAAFLASNDPAAAVLRSRATEVKTLGLRGASARVEPALRRFTSLKSIVLGVTSVVDGERLLNAAAAVSPRLATATLAFRRPRLTDADEETDFTVNAPQLTHLTLVWQAEVPHVRLMLNQWNAPALETLEFKGCIPYFDIDISSSASELSAMLLRHDRDIKSRIKDDPEVVAALRAEAEAIVSGVHGIEESEDNVMKAMERATDRVLAGRVRGFVDAGKIVVRRPPRLRKVVVRRVDQHKLSRKDLPLEALAATGVDLAFL